MTDFEGTLKRLLNENVDATLGRRRPAPRLNLASAETAGRALRPWLMPVLAAAGVAAAIAAIVVPTHLVADRPSGGLNVGGPIAPPTNAAAPPSETSDPNASPTPLPIPPAGPAVDLGSVRLRLPVGWVAREVADPNQYGSSVYSREWCLAPAKSAGQPRPDCSLQFGPAAPMTTSGVPLNGNVPLGTRLGGRSCPAYALVAATDGGLVRFGQRDGFYREWHGDCADSMPWIAPWISQYVVDTAPGYVLFSDQMTPELEAAMFEISENASLPPQTGPLLLYDVGTVKSVTRQSGGYLLTIAPAFPTIGGWVPSGEADRSYRIGPADLKYAAVGAQVGVTTDGTKVIDVGAPVGGT